MKKSIFIILPTFTLGNAIFLSLGLTCLLNLLSLAMAISLDGKSVVEQYPRFIPFCIILGIVALIGVIFLLFGNIKISGRLNFTKWLWCFQYIFALVLSIPMIKLWQINQGVALYIINSAGIAYYQHEVLYIFKPQEDAR